MSFNTNFIDRDMDNECQTTMLPISLFESLSHFTVSHHSHHGYMETSISAVLPVCDNRQLYYSASLTVLYLCFLNVFD